MQVVIDDEGTAQSVSFEPADERLASLAIIAPARAIALQVARRFIDPSEVHRDDDYLDVLFELMDPGQYHVLYDGRREWCVDLGTDGSIRVSRHGSSTCFRSPISWTLRPEMNPLASVAASRRDDAPVTERVLSWWQQGSS